MKYYLKNDPDRICEVIQPECLMPPGWILYVIDNVGCKAPADVFNSCWSSLEEKEPEQDGLVETIQAVQEIRRLKDQNESLIKQRDDARLESIGLKSDLHRVKETLFEMGKLKDDLRLLQEQLMSAGEWQRRFGRVVADNCDLVREKDKLREEIVRLKTDIRCWCMLASRQQKVIPLNHPVCPTDSAIKQSLELAPGELPEVSIEDSWRLISASDYEGLRGVIDQLKGELSLTRKVRDRLRELLDALSEQLKKREKAPAPTEACLRWIQAEACLRWIQGHLKGHEGWILSIRGDQFLLYRTSQDGGDLRTEKVEDIARELERTAQELKDALDNPSCEDPT